MADANAFDDLGEQFRAFLVQQFTAAPPTTVELAFLPGGVAVSPETFFQDGVANLLLVDEWLNTVADTVPVVSGGQVSITLTAASDMMRSVATFATATAAIGTAAANLIGGLKAQASEATTPGMKVIGTAPADWFDPAKTTNWTGYTASSPAASGGGGSTSDGGSSSGGGSSGGGGHGGWKWREAPPPSPEPVQSTTPSLLPRSLEVTPLADTALAAATPAHVFDSAIEHFAPTLITGAQPSIAGADGTASVVSQTTARAALFTAVNDADTVSPAPGHIGDIMRTLDPNSLAAIVAATAPTTPVSASSLTISMAYQLVLLSRTWWGNELVNAPGWCFAGQHAGALLPGNLGADTNVAVPVALVLTKDVTIAGSWTDADRAAVGSSSHLGPWALPSGSAFTGTSVSEILSIPGMQVIGGFYSTLPMLPPDDDPALQSASPAATASSTAP